MLFMYMITASTFLFFLVQGRSFYLSGLLERPRHADWAVLHPGGSLGMLFGIAGTVLMLLMLLYIPRKYLRSWEGLGSLGAWLDLHIWMGVSGPLLIILHSSFKVGGLVAFSFWSMTAVALSGILGRYIYLQIPRDSDGHELQHAELQLKLQQLKETGGLRQLSGETFQQGNWLLQDLHWLRKRSTLLRELKSSGTSQPKHVLRLLRERQILERRMKSLDLLRRVLHHWHVFHRPFAFIMYFFLALHIITVFLFGARLFHGAG